MKQLIAIKDGIEIGARAGLLLNAVLDGLWPIAIPENEETPTEEAVKTESDEEVIIRKTQAASSASDAMAAILQNITPLTTLVQNQQNDFDWLKNRNQ